MALALLPALPGLGAPVTVELRGDTKVWTETAPVIETADPARYQTERYGGRFSYVFTGLPAGPARLKLGFCEFKYDQVGSRVFDILVSGQPWSANFDILTRARPREAMDVAGNVTIPAAGPFVVEFVSKQELAKFNWLRLYTDAWVLEVKAADAAKVELPRPSRDAPYLQSAYETCIARFGSRLCINPRPQQGICRQTALGHADYNVAYFERDPAAWDDPPTAVYYAVRSARGAGGPAGPAAAAAASAAPPARTPDVWYSLPFNGRLPAFTEIRQRQTLTSLAYTCRAPDLPLEVTYTFRAPFYPRDLKLCVAPYVLLDVSVRNLTAREQTGSAVVAQSLRGTDAAHAVSERGCVGVALDMPVFGRSTQVSWLADEKAAGGVTAGTSLALPPAPKRAAGDAAPQRDPQGRTILETAWADAPAGLSWDFTLGPRAEASRTFAYVGWVPDPILQVMGAPYRFKYLDFFRDALEVARFAFDSRAETDRKVALFESTVQDASLSQPMKDFLAFAFQSWMQNTFYCSPAPAAAAPAGVAPASPTPAPKGAATAPPGAASAPPLRGDWFSVWEGCCKFHSTVDVEYNVAPLYFEYWPELMRMTLQEWAGYIHDGVLSHDMGMDFAADGMRYTHDMEVEENTNFVLLLYQYWRQTADLETVKQLFPRTAELLTHVIRCDTVGDGFQEEGTYNTIDQGSAAIQYAPAQVYLAVRALAAFRCGAQMAEAVGKPEVAAAWRQRATLTAKTLDAQGWLNDHYVVALNRPAPQPAGGVAPGTGGDDTGGTEAGPAPGGMGTPPELNPAPGAIGGMGGAGLFTRPGGPGPYGGRGTYGGRGSMGQQGLGSRQGAGRYEPPQGWDGYSIYTTNGLVYPLRTGMAFPELNLPRLKADVVAATLATLKRSGSPHTDHESNMWVSQNIWRDLAAAYLGIDLTDNVARYWSLEQTINRDKRGCFTDVYIYGSDGISLDYYPRGVAAFGLAPALAGLQVDKVRRAVSVAPLRTPLRVPLLAYADWSAGQIPWLNLTAGPEGAVTAQVEGAAPVEVKVREAGNPW